MASVQRVPVEKMVAAKATAAAVAVLVALTVCASVVAAGRRWSKDDDRRGGGEGSPPGGGHGEVTYDGRALIVNGTRRVLFSGDMHYTRSTPEMWPKLIAKAKQGGLDVIQTYVFWNVHEPVHGQYNFEGRYDLVKFIREIQAQGLYVSLRVGPFIEAEWKYGGFPFWLHDVPNITFRSDNEPFKQHMQRFVTKIVGLMKYEKLYYLQGGPIIISQIENEYQMVEPAFHSHGPPYVRWAAAMAVNLSTGVPWMMCKQDDAPDPVINTCNGLICGETFVGPNSPKKPALWTENWTARYPLYGHDPSSRSAGELAFAVALFIARKNGSFVNYYMYHGGTNFGRFASSYVTTSYYDGAPLDEYGLVWQRTWAHLKELHDAVKQSSEPLLWGSYSNFSLGPQQEAHVFETDSKCVAFLVNFDKHQAPNIQFRNIPLQLARRSISILSDCRKVVFETAKVNAKQGSRTTKAVQSLNGMNIWEAFKEPIPRVLNESTYTFLEQLSTTEDETDYLWYIASYDYKPSDDEEVVMLNVESRAHVLHAFVNNEYVGSVHGSHDGPPNIVLKKSVSLQEGENIISLLSVMVGSPDSGAFMERKTFGLREVSIQLGQQGPQLLNNGLWGYQVGLYGERHQIFTRGGSHTVQWTAMNNATHQPLTWYKTTFDTPTGDDPVTLNLTGMSKGEAWINGESIGRYWVSFKAPSGQPSQSLFHVPRYFLKPTSENLLVLVEEMAGDPRQITVNTMSVAMTRVCGNVNESSATSPAVRLRCEEGKRISAVEFASYGNPAGDCTSFRVGRCHAETSELVVKKACLGRSTCFVPVSAAMLGGDPCPTIDKSLLVVASCA